MLTGIQGSYWGQVLKAFAPSISILTVQNPSPELLRIGWILSVCLSVCVSVQLFAGRFLDQFEQEFNCNFMKRASKKGLLPGILNPTRSFSVPPCRGRCTLLKWRLRRHLPPRPNWWRRSWRLAPVAPPAPAGSILVYEEVVL